jgi:hypothetical protein
MKNFWSWQSDNHQPSGRYFVRDVLGRLAVELNVDATEDAERPEEDTDNIRIEVDHDTLGIGGSPPIADTILRKIREAAVFVADVTPVGKTEGGKQMPNPNVMIELGYAMKVLEHERIVLVMNTVKGAALKHLPFDLRHWRAPITYALRHDIGEERRSEVAQELKEALRERIVPSLRLAERAQREERRRTHRAPELSVVLDAEQAVVPRRISQAVIDLGVESLEQIRTTIPLLSTASPNQFVVTHHQSSSLKGREDYNRRVECYYSEYKAYLQAVMEHRRLKLRSFTVKLQLRNDGTLPATDVDVSVTFPQGLLLYSHEDDFPREPEEPEPPKQPHLLPYDIGRAFTRSARFEIPRHFVPSLTSTYIYSDERRVHFHRRELKHNHHISIDEFTISFTETEEIRSFDAQYVITANEPIDPIRGSVRFEIEFVGNAKF